MCYKTKSLVMGAVWTRMMQALACMILGRMGVSYADVAKFRNRGRFFTVFFVKLKLQFAFREQLRAHTVDDLISLIHQPIRHAYTQFYTLMLLLQFVFKEQISRV
jgi:hypothetical protein